MDFTDSRMATSFQLTLLTRCGPRFVLFVLLILFLKTTHYKLDSDLGVNSQAYYYCEFLLFSMIYTSLTCAKSPRGNRSMYAFDLVIHEVKLTTYISFSKDREHCPRTSGGRKLHITRLVRILDSSLESLWGRSDSQSQLRNANGSESPQLWFSRTEIIEFYTVVVRMHGMIINKSSTSEAPLFVGMSCNISE